MAFWFLSENLNVSLSHLKNEKNKIWKWIHDRELFACKKLDDFGYRQSHYTLDTIQDFFSNFRIKILISDFQSQFSMSKIIRIFQIIFFIEGYDFRGTLFVIDIFWKLHFLNHFIF